MDRIFIKDLKDKEQVTSVYLVKEKNLSLGKTGKPFMSILLGDNTGNIDARVWDNVDELSKEFEVGNLVQIKGNVQLFQNRKQLILSKILKVESADFNFDDFVLKSHFSSEDMFTEVFQFAKDIKNEHIRQLVFSVLEDPEIKPLMYKAPAAKTIHHAWVGGLLEHILSILKILKPLSQHYSFLNRDLLYFGAIFHDIGKLWELEFENSVGYTDRGRLIGHMEIACELIDKKSSRIFGFPLELKDLLKHIVLSHHGRLEYGSPKRPKCLEAFLVAYIDDLDSKVNQIHTFINSEKASGEKWSRFNESFERYFLLEDLNAKY
ncbi:MAG: HD domain-containing protein [Bdellovibrionaceae bacterium]|nr:HD domain-containing protein [Pseudobdellovibrionaceae bacterium]NUM57445.1 HD domain-containing protein [Pseudobdellovibrionaceae bacterium]